MRHLIRLVAIWAAASIGTAAVAAVALPQVNRIARAHQEVPLPVPDLAPQPRRSIMYDGFGLPLDVLYVENREQFSLDGVPKHAVDAVLAVEDEDFYVHEGVNGRSVMRALLANVSAGETEQGGSTITQQVVKNLILPTLPRDARTKVLEAVTAVRLEKELGKTGVLERYMNTVYLGNNAYGFQAGAERYFGKNVQDLTLPEAGMLAGLIRNPTDYDPFIRPDRTRFRFRQVLDRLVASGQMAEAEADQLAETFPLPVTPQRPATLSVGRSYYSDAVKEYLLNGSTILGDTYQQRYNALFRGGLRIHTTSDPFQQAYIEQATQLVPKSAQGFEVAAVALDTRTGAIRAMRGGPGFSQSQLNLTLRARQTGSSVKYFILAAALAAGAQPDDLIAGASPCTLPNPGVPSDPFEIKDAVSRPLADLREMTTASINCAYARLAQIVGLNRVVDTMHRMGVKKDLLAVPSLATGNNEVSPLEMASGFQTLANYGVHHEPYYVERIEGPDGRVIYQHESPGVAVFTPGVAASAIDTLKGVLISGTGRRGRLAGNRPAAGKTGTQFDNTNAWFVGASPSITTAVWMGDPKGQTPMRNVPEFEYPRIQGGTYPVLVWKAFMDAAHGTTPPEDWLPAPAPARNPARLYLPGNECTYASQVVPDPDGGQSVVYRSSKDVTTVPADVVDPTWPLPSVPAGASVFDCGKGPPPRRRVAGPPVTTVPVTTVPAPAPGAPAPPP